MIRITFMNVGQGDSIILEWEKNNQPKVGIIDSNIVNGTNPVLNYLNELNLTEIEFIILSHPHFDHYSGILEVLEYCKKNKIKIKYFIHTCERIPDYLKMAAKTAQSKRELHSLFSFILNNHDETIIRIGPVQANSMNDTLKLNSDYKLKFLSPNLKDLAKYSAKAHYYFQDPNDKGYNIDHLLCTLIKIELKDGFVLLTSDVLKDALKRIDINQKAELDGVLLLGQSPHHGSLYNHNNTFWRKRIKNKTIPIVFSVGTNKFNHPSAEVIKFFKESSFEIFSTNKIGPLNGIQKKNKDSIEKKIIGLNMFSKASIIEHRDKLQGNQIFQFS